ncbi:hypothetical protein, partial [Mycolicibacterium hodleri]
LVSRLTARAAPSSIIYVAVQQYSIVRSDAYGASPLQFFRIEEPLPPRADHPPPNIAQHYCDCNT